MPAVTGLWLMLSILGKISSRWHLKIFFLFFPENMFDISCKLSPKETICMKCKILFSGKNKKNIIYLSSAEFAQWMLKVNIMYSTYIFSPNCKSAFNSYHSLDKFSKGQTDDFFFSFFISSRKTDTFANSFDSEEMDHSLKPSDLNLKDEYEDIEKKTVSRNSALPSHLIYRLIGMKWHCKTVLH